MVWYGMVWYGMVVDLQQLKATMNPCIYFLMVILTSGVVRRCLRTDDNVAQHGTCQGRPRNVASPSLAFILVNHIMAMLYHILLYKLKQQWNTRWAFAGKHDIFTRENNMLFSHVKISTLLWLHKKIAPFASKLKRFGIHWCLYNK